MNNCMKKIISMNMEVLCLDQKTKAKVMKKNLIPCIQGPGTCEDAYLEIFYFYCQLKMT